jgi:hypothetical protein
MGAAMVLCLLDAGYQVTVQGLGQRGFPSVVQVLEQMAGVQLRTPDAL